MGRINKTNKTTPVSADEFLIYDSEDTSDDKNITLGQIATFTESQDSTISGTKIFADGVQFEKGNISFGQYSSLPTGLGSYVASYVSPTYGARLLGYNGSAYQDLGIGSMPTAGTVSMKSLANGDCDFGYNVNIAQDLGVTGDVTANKFIGDGSELINIPQFILANTTIYVATTGSDTTGDGTSGSPFLTLQKAIDHLNGKTLLGTVTIQLADGTYTSTSTITIRHPQSYLITIQGNTTTPSNCILSYTGSGHFIYPDRNSTISLHGVKLLGTRASGSMGVRANNSCLLLSRCIVDGFDWNIYATDLAEIIMTNNCATQNAVTALICCTALSHCCIGDGTTLTGYSSVKTTYGICSNWSSQVIKGAGALTISNCAYGSFCDHGSMLVDTSITYSSCTTSRSPASNTVGNNNSYIST